MSTTVPTRPDVSPIELPTDLAATVRTVSDRDSAPETLQAAIGLFEDQLGDAAIVLDDLYQSHQTRHVVQVRDRVEHVPCVGDAMVVALARDTRPARIDSTPPDGGEAVTFHVTEDAVEVTPEGAVVSFGLPHAEVETDGAAVRADLNAASTVPAGCPLINAFPDAAAYQRWATDVSNAAVMALDVDEFVAVVHQLVGALDLAAPTLDADVAANLAAAFDLERPPDTIAAVVDEATGTFETSLDRSLQPRDMCTTDDSPHRARVGDQTFRYQCVLDAFILGHLLSDPVTVETVCKRSDAEVRVEFEDAGWSIATAPGDAVMSYGVERGATPPDGEVTPENLYGQVCGYSHVFASAAAYEAWDRTTPTAATDAYSLVAGIDLAGRMVDAFEVTDDGPDCC